MAAKRKAKISKPNRRVAALPEIKPVPPVKIGAPLIWPDGRVSKIVGAIKGQTRP